MESYIDLFSTNWQTYCVSDPELYSPPGERGQLKIIVDAITLDYYVSKLLLGIIGDKFIILFYVTWKGNGADSQLTKIKPI